MRIRVKLAVLSIAIVLAAIFAVPALAHSQPSVSQVKRELATLTKRVDMLDQQYDQVNSQATLVKNEVRLSGAQLAAEGKIAAFEQRQVAQIAVTEYESGYTTNPFVLMTQRDYQSVLSKGSVLEELSLQDQVVLKRFYAQEAALGRLRLTEARQQVGVHELAAQARKMRQQMAALTRQEDALLGIYPSLAWPVGSSAGHYSGPTKTQAEKAVAFAYAQLGCPYTWGGVGPCKAGFDCSGLVMQAWAYAGVSIPRTSQEQWAQLPQVAPSEMQPGDLIIMLGGDHVGMYVGHGWMIDAPHTGANVERIRYDGWPSQNTVGIVRP